MLRRSFLGALLQGCYRGLADGWRPLIEVFGGDVELGVHEEADVILLSKIRPSSWLRVLGNLELDRIVLE